MAQPQQPALGEPARRQRKVRSDKGKRKPHPPTCRHCVEMVAAYRLQRYVEWLAVENGGFRNEDWRSNIITLRKWLRVWRYEPVDDGPVEPLPADDPEGTQALWDAHAGRVAQPVAVCTLGV